MVLQACSRCTTLRRPRRNRCLQAQDIITFLLAASISSLHPVSLCFLFIICKGEFAKKILIKRMSVITPRDFRSRSAVELSRCLNRLDAIYNCGRNRSSILMKCQKFLWLKFFLFCYSYSFFFFTVMMYSQPMYGAPFMYSPMAQQMSYPMQQSHMMAQSMQQYTNTMNPLGLTSSNYEEVCNQPALIFTCTVLVFYTIQKEPHVDFICTIML